MNAIALTILFSSATQQFDLPKDLLESICYVESAHNINAIHKDDGDSNSVGICQVKLKTAKWLGFKGTEKQLMKPSINIHYAAKYLSHQLLRYRNNKTKAIISYNRGSAGILTSTKYSDKVYSVWRISNARRHKQKNNYCAYRY